MQEHTQKKALLFLELCLTVIFIFPAFLSGILLLFFAPLGLGVLIFLFFLYAFFSFWWIPRLSRSEFVLISADVLQIRRGLFIQKNIFIPRTQIRSCTFSSSVLQRPFGLVSLRWMTISGSVSFANLEWEQALRIAKFLSLPIPNTALQRMTPT